jgi:hypothetical protein
MRWIISGFIILTIMSCSSTQKETKVANKQTIDQAFNKGTERYTRRTLAGKCRISATVISVDSTLTNSKPDDICAKFPCRAVISIDKILGYGSGFNTKLAPGQELVVKFQFTLAPSEKALPGLQLELPGLKNGQHFIADLEETMNIGTDERSFTIYRYELTHNTGVK